MRYTAEPKPRLKPMRRYGQVSFLILILLHTSVAHASPVLSRKTLDAWKTYVDLTQARINGELKVLPARLRTDPAILKTGKIQVQRLETPNAQGKEIEIPDGAVHHWLGAIFIPGVTLDKVVSWVQNYPQYKDYFQDVERADIRSRNGDTFEIFLRLKRSKLGVTVHFNTKHHIVYGPRSPGFLASISESTEIRQVKDPGSKTESEYPEGDDSGYLWRLNSYWRFTERDGGVLVECESIGLSRSLGWGLGFLNILTLGKVKGIAESIAREALEQTLTDLREGVRGGPKKDAN
jgi:hypothetical protein